MVFLGLLLWKVVGEVVPVESVSMWAAGILAAMFVLVSLAAHRVVIEWLQTR